MKKLVLFIFVTMSLSSCDTIIAKFSKKIVGKTAEEAIEESSERAVTKTVVRKGLVQVVKDGTEEFVERSLKDLASNSKIYKDIYEKIISTSSKDVADDIVVRTTKDGVEFLSKRFPETKMIVNNNTIIAKAGSLKNAGPLNQFLNDLLPNKTYVIDDCFVFKTDEFGRVIFASADRTKAKTIQRNARHGQVQNMVKKKLNGIDGDDAGHLFANSTGGPNELINQVPMSAKINRQGGAWRELELLEENALNQGKKVVSQRRLLYKGDSKRPYAIEFIMEIDGVKQTHLIPNI